jgi:alkylresorcinol/alkylpyrone synthase
MSTAETNAPRLAAVAGALPDHYATQEELTAAFRDYWSKEHFNPARLDDLHRAVGVSGRHLALPPTDYLTLDTFTKSNAAFQQVAPVLGERAIRAALEAAGLSPKDIDALFFVTVTGIAAPSVDALLMNCLKLRPDVKRTPIFGLGCVAGAAGMARAADYLRAFPEHTAVLLSVELCSLTLQRDDLSIPNIIASGLFGDGAAAVVLTGAQRKDAQGSKASASSGPRIVASRSVFYPDTERVMGWDVTSNGFKVVLSSKVPTLAREHIGADVDEFLASRGLRRADIQHWVAHTGGPKVLMAFQETLGLGHDALARSWNSLRTIGNLSSASVLFVLRDLLSDLGPAGTKAGDRAMVLAMGPGFCSEVVLLEW